METITNHFPTGAETEQVVYQKGQDCIVRWVAAYAYPRSGNFHNPTPRYTWTAYRGSENLGSAYTLRGAKELFSEITE